MQIQLPDLGNGRSGSGSASEESVSELMKALTAGYGTDVSALTGGGALRIQSLDKTLMATIAENDDCKLMKALMKSNATATVDEWTEQDKVGGFLGGSTNTEDGAISDFTGNYRRRTAQVKYLMTRRQVSLVQRLQNNIVDAEATEQNSGAVQLLQDAEYLSFEGDERVVPTEYSGIRATLETYGLSDNIFDARGGPVHDVTTFIAKASALIKRRPNFGFATHLFMSPDVQVDFDTTLSPQFRVALAPGDFSSVQIGAPVTGIRTTAGTLTTMDDTFIRDNAEKYPFQIDNPAIAAANAFVPATLQVGNGGNDVGSMFGAPQAGNYYYLVSGVNAKGQSVGISAAQIAIAAGEKAVLTIGQSAPSTETGYVIYRSRRNGTNGLMDYREMLRIPRNPTGNTTVFVDLNREIPGTTQVYVLTMKPGYKSIGWRQFLPMFRFDLAATNTATIPWAQLLFGYLRLAKARQHVVIKNVLPMGALWQPF